MDIGRFVDSAAIRAYLKEQNYPFSAQEAAFLVYQCKTASLEERVRAWEEIIRTMPNCSLEKTRCREEIPDFHAFLRRCSALLRRQARQFQQTDGCVFSYEDASFSEKAYRAESGLFSTYDRCRDACVQEMREEGWDRARIRKHKPDKTEFGCGDVCCLNRPERFCAAISAARRERPMNPCPPWRICGWNFPRRFTPETWSMPPQAACGNPLC